MTLYNLVGLEGSAATGPAGHTSPLILERNDSYGVTRSEDVMLEDGQGRGGRRPSALVNTAKVCLVTVGEIA